LPKEFLLDKFAHVKAGPSEPFRSALTLIDSPGSSGHAYAEEPTQPTSDSAAEQALADALGLDQTNAREPSIDLPYLSDAGDVYERSPHL